MIHKTSTKKREKPAPIDWQAIELVYRTTSMPAAQLAREFGVTPKALDLRRARYGWTKDVVASVRERTKRAVATHSRHEPQTPGEVIIQTVAERVAEDYVQRAVDINLQIIGQHRQDLESGRTAVEALLRELIHDSQPDVMDDIIRMIEIETTSTSDSNEEGKDSDEEIDWKRRQRMLLAVSLGTRAGAAQKLAAAYKTIMEAQRLSYGIDDSTGKEKPQDTLASVLKEIDGRTLALPITLKRKG